MKSIRLISLFLAYVHSTPECVSKVEKAKCDLIKGQCWCYFEEGVLPSSICGYPDGYSGEYYSLADAFPWTKEFSPWNIMTTFGKVPWERHCGYGSCNGNGAGNVCFAYRGCWGNFFPAHITNQSRWERRGHGGPLGDGGFVRCKDIEDAIQSNLDSVQSCNDEVQNNDESGVDCGGSCAVCPTCDDGLQNQDETGIDCGGQCPVCPTCNDGIQNQDETSIDFGGSCSTCSTCNDGIQNQDETDIDCGGSCPACIVDACLKENTRYMGANIPKKYLKKNVGSAEDCQQECQENSECLFFTWNQDKNQCTLKKEKGKAKTNCGKQCTGKVSGPKNC